MRDLTVLFLHLLATLARLAGPGGARSVVAESLLLKQQLLILNRSRKRSPNLRFSDRLVAGVCALLICPRRLIRSAIVLKPSTLLSVHKALTKRKYRRLCLPKTRSGGVGGATGFGDARSVRLTSVPRVDVSKSRPSADSPGAMTGGVGERRLEDRGCARGHV